MLTDLCSSDDRTTRYVAECNIEPLDVPWPAMSLMQCAGKYFRRWDPERRLFVSNIREQYPDD